MRLLRPPHPPPAPGPSPGPSPASVKACKDAGGILGSRASPYTACCKAECGTCGGKGCAGRPGGKAACCAKEVLKAGRGCSRAQPAPCVCGTSAPAPGGRPLDGSHFLGYNVVNLQSGNFSQDAHYLAATDTFLHAGVLRYPGGNLANWWDWRSGWCVPNDTPHTGCPLCRHPCANKRRRRVYRLAEFMLAVNRSGATPLLTLNMMTRDLDDSLAFLAAAQAQGALENADGAPAYVELGGEFYWGKYAGYWPTGRDYAEDANAWAQAIKARFPSLRVLAVGASSVANSAAGDRGYTWNGQVYETVDSSKIHGVTLHPYLHLDDPKGGPAPLQPQVPPRQKGEGPTGWYNSSSVQQASVDLLRTVRGADMLFGVPPFLATLAAGNAATHQAIPAGSSLRIVVTEWNVMERAGPLKLSWLHAVFIASGALHMLSEPRVEAALLHVLLNGYGWGALYETSADFDGPFGGTPPPGSTATALGQTGCLVSACQGLTTMPYAPTAVGSALGALAWNMQGATWAQPLAFEHDANPMRSGGVAPAGLKGNVSFPTLQGWLFTNNKSSSGSGVSTRSNATVLNLGPDTMQFTPPGGCVSYTTWESPGDDGPLAWATTDRPVMRTSKPCGDRGFKIQLAPYSITTVTGAAVY